MCIRDRDDTDRVGEKDTLREILALLSENREDVYHQTLSGIKATSIITNKKFLTSL